jgi:arsenical pump membrane protein
LILLLVGFFVLEPLGIPVSAIAAVGAVILFAVAKRGHAINTGKVLRGAPWQIVIFSLGMYLVVYGLRNAGLTEYLSGVLNVLADKGLWAATLGTGLPDGFPVFHHEQHAYRAGWRSFYRWKHCNWRY